MKKKVSKSKAKGVQKVLNRILKKGQNWSLDLILGIVIFMLILSVFYMLLSRNSTTNVSMLKVKGTNLMNDFDVSKSDNPFAIIEGNTVNLTKIEELYLKGNYDAIKRDLGIEGEFCIVLEDTNGRIVVVEDGSYQYYGFGNPELNISGCPCGTRC